MSWPAKFVFEILNDQWLQIAVEDGIAALTGATLSITDATVTAKLYKNRVVGDPLRPGSLVTSFGTGGSLALTWVFNDQNGGNYRGLVTETLNDSIGTNYVITFDVSTPGGATVFNETKAQLIVRQSG